MHAQYFLNLRSLRYMKTREGAATGSLHAAPIWQPLRPKERTCFWRWPMGAPAMNPHGVYAEIRTLFPPKSKCNDMLLARWKLFSDDQVAREIVARLTRLAYSMGVYGDEAADLAQEAWLRTFNKLDSKGFESQDDFYRYAAAVLRNLVIRRNRFTSTVALNEDLDSPHELSVAEIGSIFATYWQAILKLPAPYSSVLLLQLGQEEVLAMSHEGREAFRLELESRKGELTESWDDSLRVASWKAVVDALSGQRPPGLPPGSSAEERSLPLTDAEIGVLLGKSQENVYVLRHRARKMLRQILIKMNEEDSHGQL